MQLTIDQGSRAGWLRRWWPFRRRALNHGTEQRVLIGGYVRPNLLQRHRRKALGVLATIALFYGFAFGLFGQFILLQLAIPLALMAVLVIWLLPDGSAPPVKALTRLLIAFLVVLLCWPNYLALSLPGLPWITALRLTAVPLAVVFLTSLSISSIFRRELMAILNATSPIWKLMIVFAILTMISIAFSAYPVSSANKFMVAQLNWTLIFFASAYVFSRPGRATLLTGLLWGSVIVVSVIALIENDMGAIPWAGRIPSFLAVNDEVVQRILAGGGRSATGIYRVKSVQTTPLGLAEFLALTSPFILHYIITATRPWIRVAALVTFPTMFYIILLTDSRLGMVGMLSSCLLYVITWALMLWRRKPDSLIAPAVILAYPAVFALTILATFFVRRLRLLIWGGGATAASTDARKIQIELGMPKILSEPWGYGIGQGGNVLGFTNPAGQGSIDQYYISIALEYGVIGFFVYYGMFGLAIFFGGKYYLAAKDEETRLLAPMTLALINFVIIKSVFSQEANHPLVFAILGAVVALVYRVRATMPVAANTRRMVRSRPAISLRDRPARLA